MLRIEYGIAAFMMLITSIKELGRCVWISRGFKGPNQVFQLFQDNETLDYGGWSHGCPPKLTQWSKRPSLSSSAGADDWCFYHSLLFSSPSQSDPAVFVFRPDPSKGLFHMF